MGRLTFWALLILVADQLSKYAVVFGLDLKTRLVHEVFPPFLTFRMAWNRGVNFGLFANDADVMRWVLAVVAIGISLWVVLWIRREEPRPLMQVSGGILVGGALGNAIDRVAQGAVMDFLNMSCCGIANPYSFNVADIAIFVGVFGLIAFGGAKNTP